MLYKLINLLLGGLENPMDVSTIAFTAVMANRLRAGQDFSVAMLKQQNESTQAIVQLLEKTASSGAHKVNIVV